MLSEWLQKNREAANGVDDRKGSLQKGKDADILDKDLNVRRCLGALGKLVEGTNKLF